MKRRVAPLRHVDVAAADPVDPLVGAHRAPAVALCRAAPSARGRGCARRWSPAAARRPPPRLDVEVGGRADPQVGAEQAARLPGPRRGSRPAPRGGRWRAGPRARASAARTERRALTRRQTIPGRCYGRSPVSELPENFQTAPLAEVDPEIAAVLDGELRRQQRTLEMIASENFVPQAVLDAVGSVLTNKYAEGYPGRRYYGGCEEVDVAEELAIDRAKELFGAEHANVQAHAGAQANNAAYMALIEPGDTILGMALDHGGHLSHGMKINVSGKLYNPVAYHVRREDLLVDMDEVAQPRRGAQAEADRRRLVRLPAPARLRRLPRDRRLGRGQADGRHGPLRRPRRRRRAPQPGRRTPTSSRRRSTRPSAARAAA